MLAWTTLSFSRRALLLAAIAFFVAAYVFAWPRTGAPLRAHVACAGQILALAGLLLNPAVVRWSAPHSFRTWPRLCQWLFATGFCLQLVALAALVLSR